MFRRKYQQMSGAIVPGHRDPWQFGPHRGDRRFGEVQAVTGEAFFDGLLRQGRSGAPWAMARDQPRIWEMLGDGQGSGKILGNSQASMVFFAGESAAK